MAPRLEAKVLLRTARSEKVFREEDPLESAVLVAFNNRVEAIEAKEEQLAQFGSNFMVGGADAARAILHFDEDGGEEEAGGRVGGAAGGSQRGREEGAKGEGEEGECWRVGGGGRREAIWV